MVAEAISKQQYDELVKINHRYIGELSLIRRLCDLMNSASAEASVRDPHLSQSSVNDAIIQVLMEELDPAFVKIYLKNEHQLAPVCSRYSSGFPRDTITKGTSEQPFLDADHAVADRCPMVSRKNCHENKSKSVLITLPLITRDQCLGALQLYFENCYNPSEGLPGLSIIAGLAANMIKNSPTSGTKAVDTHPYFPTEAPGFKVLLIDDSPDVLDIISTMLVRRGYNVTALSHGKDITAVEDLASFELVITDLEMPEVSGYQIAQTVKSANPQIPVILMTGASAALDQDYLDSVGVSHFLSKPFGGRALDQAVKSVCQFDSQAGST